MADLTEGFWLYAKDGARYQARIYHVRLDTSHLDGEPSSMPWTENDPLAGWHSPQLRRREHVHERSDR
jgi:hypothetical protein